jgi:hypothetical protein
LPQKQGFSDSFLENRLAQGERHETPGEAEYLWSVFLGGVLKFKLSAYLIEV